MATTIGVIDDDDALRDSIHALLTSYGYEVRAYASAEDFLSAAAAPMHCLLVDQHMPGMTGLGLLERLRAQGDTTPAFVITGQDNKPLHERAAQIGVRVFRKPLPVEFLVELVEHAIGQ